MAGEGPAVTGEGSADPQVLLVFTNAPDRAVAAALATALVEARLVACANIIGECESVYRWEGAIERAREVPMILKTTLASFDAVAAAIRARHPHQVPEILAVPVTQGLPAYLAWVAAETAR
jgi:periplasmic divalent cation tolerance protein